MDQNVIAELQTEPALTSKVAVNIFNHQPESAEASKAAEVTRNSDLITTLLSERDSNNRIPFHPYKKWNGAHWILAVLADLSYPAGDESLQPMMEQSYQWLLSERHKKYIRVINGRTRRCASLEGYAVWYSLRLGLSDDRTKQLVDRLLKWQWPDGGWNCDKRPEADTSSFMESLIPLRALSLYAAVSSEQRVKQSVERAAEVFLSRQLFKRRSDGKIIHPQFVRLHYPCYWHYDFLFALKVMAEAGFLEDSRCTEALDLLESKRLPDGGFPAEAVYYQTRKPKLSGYSLVDWSGVSKIHLNPFVTIDALYVLQAAHRL